MCPLRVHTLWYYNQLVLAELHSIGAILWQKEYESNEEISVPFLNPVALAALSEYVQQVEHLGKSRYGLTRPCYPPGEVAMNFAEGGLRKSIFTDVKMTAVSSGRMTKHAAAAATGGASTTPLSITSSPVQWIYHSPHLREFLRVVMKSTSLHQCLSDLGVAINIMRPVVVAGAGKDADTSRTAFGFLFDSINSSEKVSKRAEEEVVEDDTLAAAAAALVSQPCGAT
jgi:hypothetical protein